jgi:hypothetical protein
MVCLCSVCERVCVRMCMFVSMSEKSVCVCLVCGVRDCHPQIRYVTNRKKNEKVA